MRVLAVLIRTNVDNEIGGSERSFVELSNALVEGGVEVDTLEVGSSVSNSMASRLNHYVLDSSTKLPLRYFRHAFDAVRIARNRGCEVVFAPALYWPETVFVALVASILIRKPLFIGIPGPFRRDEDELTVFGLFKQRLEGRRSSKTTIAALLRRFAFRSADGLLFITNHMAREHEGTFGAMNSVIIGRGIDDSWFRLEETPTPKDYDAVFVGRLDKGKGVDTLIRSWKSVTSSIPSARLLVVGTGPRADEFKRLAEENGLRTQVIFAGYVSSPLEIRKKVRSSKLLVLPSEEEGFARVVSEAMACGTPCVISDIPGLRELYAGAAVFVPSRDPATLALAIESLLSDDERRGELSRAGMLRAKRFSWKNSAALTYAAFAQACNYSSEERTGGLQCFDLGPGPGADSG